ncbi:MAG TPA: TPM domain-containing protein [Candidatus Nanoarchaeia archaeon]|nr:TPM domain-containing protein [Candidatus Nanoarchaeia archaeon]
MTKKILLFIILLAGIVSAKPVLNYWVVDEAGILSPETEQALVGLFESVEKQTTAEMAVVTVKSLEGEPIEEYSLSLAHNNLGKADKDNGLLILVAVDDRKYRIEVGQGLEGILNDAKVGRIGREYFVQYFKEGKYDEGILLGAQEIAKIITGDQETIQKYEQQVSIWQVIPLEFYFWIFILIIMFVVSVARYKKRKKTDNRDFFLAWVMADMFSRGGRGRFGGSGGFSGFGGGGFSGGGVGGRW